MRNSGLCRAGHTIIGQRFCLLPAGCKVAEIVLMRDVLGIIGRFLGYGMFIWQDRPRRKARIEIIPMIDVMMFLLVFFVLISMNVIPAMGLKTQLPGSTQLSALDHTYHVVITIGAGGRIQLNGEDYSRRSLAQRLEDLEKQHKQMDVVVDGDKDSLLQNLIDVMDVVKASGISAISIVAKKK
jgi:biopolymer transport protein ExbD